MQSLNKIQKDAELGRELRLVIANQLNGKWLKPDLFLEPVHDFIDTLNGNKDNSISSRLSQISDKKYGLDYVLQYKGSTKIKLILIRWFDEKDNPLLYVKETKCKSLINEYFNNNVHFLILRRPDKTARESYSYRLLSFDDIKKFGWSFQQAKSKTNRNKWNLCNKSNQLIKLESYPLEGAYSFTGNNPSVYEALKQLVI